MKVYYYFNPYDENGGYGVLYDILVERRIKVSQILRLNDPFDCQVGFSPEFTQDEIDDLRKKFMKIGDIMGIICFSASVDNVLMWSHYAKQHEGFVLGIDVPNKFLSQVKYSSAIPEIFKDCSEPDNPYYRNSVFDIVRTKSLDWSYEKEWRMFVQYSDNQFIQEVPQKDGAIVRYLKLDSCNIAIDSIFIGLRCKISPDRVAQLLHRTGFDKIDVYKMDSAQSGYSLSFIPCKTGEDYYKRQEQIKSAIMRIVRPIKVVGANEKGNECGK